MGGKPSRNSKKGTLSSNDSAKKSAKHSAKKSAKKSGKNTRKNSPKKKLAGKKSQSPGKSR